MELSYLDIEKDLIPYHFSIVIQGKLIQFLIRYNSVSDFFTADIFDKDGNTIAYAKKFLIGVNLFENIIDERLPEVEIIPFDPSEEHDKITYDNFMKAVKPYIFEVRK